MRTLTIRGADTEDIPSFYAEINRVFMADEDWSLGESLDALDDMLRGAYGAVCSSGMVRVVWLDVEKARSSLGREATRAFLSAKLERPDVFDAKLIGRRLAALEAGTEPTYFETVIEIFTGHSNIEFVSA